MGYKTQHCITTCLITGSYAKIKRIRILTRKGQPLGCPLIMGIKEQTQMCLLSSKWWTSDEKGELIKQAEMSAFFDGCDRQKNAVEIKKKKNKKKA